MVVVMWLLVLCGVGLCLLLAGDRYRVPFLVDVGAVLALASVLAIPVGYGMGTF